MDKDAKRRPLYLAKILYEKTDENHSLTTAQLMRELKEYGITAHRQTVKSDIQLLQNFGLEIQEVKSSQNKYNVISRTFDLPELKLLIDAVASSKFITKSKSKDLVAKLTSTVSEYQRPELKRNISCENRVKSKNEMIYLIIDAINRAINENKKISFHYFHFNKNKRREMKNNGEPYIITPLYLVWNGDFYYMIGVNEDRLIRTFRVDRIADWPEILEEKGTKPLERFNINRYLNSTFHMFDSEQRPVELICDNDVMDAVIDRFGLGVKKSKNDENTFMIVVNVAVSHVFYSWVFGFGGKVRIHFPEDVKNAYADMVRQAAEELGQE